MQHLSNFVFLQWNKWKRMLWKNKWKNNHNPNPCFPPSFPVFSLCNHVFQTSFFFTFSIPKKLLGKLRTKIWFCSSYMCFSALVRNQLGRRRGKQLSRQAFNTRCCFSSWNILIEVAYEGTCAEGSYLKCCWCWWKWKPDAPALCNRWQSMNRFGIPYPSSALSKWFSYGKASCCEQQTKMLLRMWNGQGLLSLNAEFLDPKTAAKKCFDHLSFFLKAASCSY